MAFQMLLKAKGKWNISYYIINRWRVKQYYCYVGSMLVVIKFNVS